MNTANRAIVIYPIYGVRFDVLSKWFENFSVKNIQDQRDRPSIAFTGNMLSMQDKFYFRLDKNGYSDDFNNFRVNLEKCAMNLPDVGADWIFIDLALCKLVNPTNFDKLKQIILSHVKIMYERKEPNILDYYDQLEHIFHYLEYNKI